jgi:hypothetical protein
MHDGMGRIKVTVAVGAVGQLATGRRNGLQGGFAFTLSVVTAICARSHHLETDSEDVFAISPAVGYLMLGLGLIIAGAPFPPHAAGDISAIRFFTDTTMTVDAFRRHHHSPR